MRINKVCLSAICAVAISAVNVSAVDLGTISVESSTINDTAVDQKTEASTVNVITEKEINEIDPKNINDLLQTIPGVTADVRSDVVEIHLRGIAQQEFMWEDTGVAIVIDGVPVLQDGGKVTLNMDEIESIKVIKGSASYLYGANALAGAVIITTKKNKDKNSASVNIEAGSYGYKNLKGKISLAGEKTSFNGLAAYKTEDGYWYKSANDKKMFNGLFTYYIDDMSDLALGVDYSSGYTQSGRGSVTGVTEAEENPTAEGDYAWTADKKLNLEKYYLKYNKDFNNGGNLLVNVYYYKDSTTDWSSPIDTSGDVNASGALVYDGSLDGYAKYNIDDVKQYGFKSEYRGKIKKLAYLVGADIGQRKSESYSNTIYTGVSDRGYDYFEGESSYTDNKEDKYALYGEVKYRVMPKLTTVFNARYDHNKYDYTSTGHDASYDDNYNVVWEDTDISDSVTYDNMSYRVGATYNFKNNNTLYANVSTGFRNPRVEDLYAGDIRGYSRGRLYVNNPDIDTETTITYEVGSRGKIFGDYSYEASVFVMDTKDIIGKVNGTYYSGDVVYYDNIGDARNKGLELSLKSRRSKKVSFSLSYTYLDAYYTKHNPFYVSLEGDDAVYDIVGNQLPRVPHHKIDLIVNYKFMPKWKLMTELYAQSHYYADETNLVTMPGYAKVNMRVDYNVNKKLNFYLKVDNVLDKQYYRTVYLFSDRNDDGKLDAEDASITVDPGRVWYAGFTYKF